MTKTKKERLNLKEFVTKYAEINNISKVKAQEEISRFIETLGEVVKQGNGVTLYGFGNVDVYTLPAGDVKNPLTGGFVTKPERNTVKFKFSNTFKSKLNA